MDFSRTLQHPNIAVEAIVAFAAVAMAIVGRVVIDMVAPGVLPFVLTFPAIIFASLVAGPRAGAAAVIVCQLLVWYFVFPPRGSFALTSTQAASLAFSTFSLLLTVGIAAAYRRANVRLAEEKERRLELLALALREVDHRTKNNFQIAASLLTAQAKAKSSPVLRQELRHAANRLSSIAGVYSGLALSSADLSTVMLQDYLRDLSTRFAGGMLPSGVTVAFAGDAVEVPAQTAIAIGLIVNECLTNAAKHAFPDGEGKVTVTVRNTGTELVVGIADDGVGAGAESPAKGSGTALIATLSRSIDAIFETSDDKGRACLLRLSCAAASLSRRS